MGALQTIIKHFQSPSVCVCLSLSLFSLFLFLTIHKTSVVSTQPNLLPLPMAKLSPFPFATFRTAFFAFLLCSCSFSSSCSFSAAEASEATTIHELLRNHGLPGGLIPKDVESFFHNATSGLLEVRLYRPCYAHYYDGLAYFDSEVRGNLSYGALHGVVGWSQEELFLWLPVKGIVITDPASGVILFDIGVARKRLAASAFEVPPDCRPVAERAGARIGEPARSKTKRSWWPAVRFLLD